MGALLAHVSVRNRLSALAIVGLFLALYASVLTKMVEYWTLNDMYSYAFAVPLISGFVVWLKRADLAETPASPSLTLGCLVLAAGLATMIMGRVSSTNLLEELSIVITIAGVTLLLFGVAVFRVLAFPIGYLMSMVPVWEYVTNRLHPYFQIYSATLGVNLVRLTGVPVLRRGFLIELPNVNLEVAEACSGINYLIAVFCLGIPMTYLFVRSWSKRAFIISSATVIALLANGVRVAIVCLFAYYGIRGANGDIHGPFALFRSLLISGVGFMVVFGLVFKLADSDGLFYTLSHRLSAGAMPREFGLRPAAVALTVLLLGSAVVFAASHRVGAVPMPGDLRVLPTQIGRWEFRTTDPVFHDLERVQFDTKLSRNYRSPDGAELNLFLGYFQTQEQGRELAGYTVRTALGMVNPSGYSLEEESPTEVNDFLIDRGSETFHVTYWYVLDGEVVASESKAKLFTAWDSLVHGKSNGALVVVRTKTDRNESIEAARIRVRDFIQDFVAMSRDYLPQS